MSKYGHDKTAESGIITVYLALSLGIILSFIMTTIEVARTNTANTYFNRVLQTSMESILCDYYLPLFERYHLFGMDAGAGNMKEKAEVVKAKIIGGIQEDVTSQEEILSLLWNQSSRNFLMCNPELKDAEVKNMICLPDEGGLYARQQMTSYMKYQAPMDLLEKMLDALNLIEEAEIVSEALNDKIELEVKTMEIDKSALRLLELVEGIQTNENGLEFSKFLHNLDHNDSFVKQIVCSEPTMQSVRVFNKDIFKEIEDEYVQFPQVLDQLVCSGENLMAEEEWIQEQTQLEADERLSNYEKDRLKERKEQYEQNCYMNRMLALWMTGKVTELEQLLDSALKIIDGIEEKRKRLQGEYNNYNQEIEALQGQISEDIYADLKCEDELLKTYSDSNISKFSIICDVEKMKETLLWNQSVIDTILQIPLQEYSLDPEQFEVWKQGITAWRDQLYQLHVDGLEFDYTGLSTRANSSIFSGILDMFFGASYTEMLVGKENVSKEKLVEQELISSNLQISSDFMEEIKQKKSMGELLDGGLSIGRFKAEDTGIANDLLQKLLLTSYVTEHFSNYTSKNTEVNYGLQYEQEYILGGRMSDAENLAGVIRCILAFRFIMNGISVLTDPAKHKKAMETATVLVGWIPLAGVVYVVKYLILFYWAYCEATLETAALLRGYEVPLYTRKEDFVVEYGDLTRISETYIEEKTKDYKCVSSLTMDYSQYLFLFLLLVPDIGLTFRSLDMIQDNLRYEYDDEFFLKNCIISFGVEAEANMETKFFILPFFLNDCRTPTGYTIKAANSVIY